MHTQSNSRATARILLGIRAGSELSVAPLDELVSGMLQLRGDADHVLTGRQSAEDEYRAGLGRARSDAFHARGRNGLIAVELLPRARLRT
jgi:hypothetical protein